MSRDYVGEALRAAGVRADIWGNPTPKPGPDDADYQPTQHAEANHHSALDDPPPVNSPDDYGQPVDDDEQNMAPIPNKKTLVAFPLVAFENITLDTEHRGYLVKGLLPNRGLAVVWGPPKCGKSFWAADLGMHIALGWDYRGHKVQQAPVVYLALEGRYGFPARIEAFRRHHGIESAPPFYLLSASLDLVAKSGQLIASIKNQLRENLPGALFLDTLNRSLVGSESKDEDMARFLAAAEKIAQELNCAVVIVHHCGIDATRPRGHTSLSGAVESQLAVKRSPTGEVIVTVELAKDFEEGTQIVSRFERVELGSDPDGDPITSLVVVAADPPTIVRNINRKLSDRQHLALAALEECAATRGEPAPAGLGLPAGTIVVQLSAWREGLYRKGVLDRDAKSPREEFKRVRNSLQARGLIGIRDDFTWKA
jgi:AAA domain